MLRYDYTNIAPSIPGASLPPGRSFLDSLEVGISRFLSFSAHGKLADASFPNWTAVLLTLAFPIIVAVLLVIVARSSNSRAGWTPLLWAAWLSLGAVLGAMIFGACDLGVATLILAGVLGGFSIRCYRGHPGTYRNMVRGVTLVFLAFAPGALVALVTGTFINPDLRNMLGVPHRPPEVLRLFGLLRRPYPGLWEIAQQARVSIQLADGSVGPLAELYQPVIGPTTITLDQRLVRSAPERAAACLAHELMHVAQQPRRLPGIIGIMILDMERRDLLQYEKEAAEIQSQFTDPLALLGKAQLPTQADVEAFYPEYKYGRINMLLRRLGAAALLVAAYLLWPRLRKCGKPRERSESIQVLSSTRSEVHSANDLEEAVHHCR